MENNGGASKIEESSHKQNMTQLGFGTNDNLSLATIRRLRIGFLHSINHLGFGGIAETCTSLGKSEVKTLWICKLFLTT